jgi:hypothetical protein
LVDFAEDEKIEIFDTKRENNLAIHLAEELPSDLYETFTAKIDEKKRTAQNAITRLRICLTKRFAKCSVRMLTTRLYVSPRYYASIFLTFRK